MNTVLKLAQQHYAAQKSRAIQIPEWNTAVYAFPVTLVDQASMLKAQSKHGPDSIEMFAEVIIARAKDTNGTPIFSAEDFEALTTTVDFQVLQRIANDILDVPGVDDLKKS